MAFNLENKIRWEELSPSLQDKFKQIWGPDGESVMPAHNITEIWKKLGSALSASHNLDKLLQDGLDGQVVKIDANLKKFYPDDNYRELRVVSSTEEKDSEKAIIPIDLEDVFNTWNKVSYYAGKWNGTDAESIKRYSYKYSKKYNAIVNPFNANANLSFISPSNFDTNFMINIHITRDMNIYNDVGVVPQDYTDDDLLYFVVAAIKNSDGSYSDISVCRTGGMQSGNWDNGNFCIYYNATSITYNDFNKANVLAELQLPNRWWIDGECYLKIVKTDNMIEAWTSDIATSVVDVNPNYYIRYVLPSTKPSTMNSSMYNTIKNLLSNKNKIGFGTFSNCGAFMIADQKYIFEDNKIYDLTTDSIYEYDKTTGTWVLKGTISQTLPNRILLYNPRSCKLYYYYYKHKYTELTPMADIINETKNLVTNIYSTENYPPKGSSIEYGNGGLTGMVKRLDKENNTTFWEDYFHIIRVTTDSSSTSFEKSLNIDLKDVFDKWKRVSYYSDGWNGSGSASVAARAAYRYAEQYACIVNTVNSDPSSAFLSNQLYDNNFMIKIKITRDRAIYSSVGSSPDNDDDALFFCCGAIENADGSVSDVSVVRIGGIDGQWGTFTFLILYNCIYNVYYFNVTQMQSNVLARFDVPKRRWSDGNCYLKIIKTPGKIEAWTSDIASGVTDINTNYHCVYELPSSCPSGWSQDKYNTLSTLMKGSSSRIGFGTLSNAGAFQIVDQQYLFHDEIYDLSTDTVWKYQNGRWTKIGKISEKVPPRSLLYNKRTQKLIWYISPEDYQEITFA